MISAIAEIRRAQQPTGGYLALQCQAPGAERPQLVIPDKVLVYLRRQSELGFRSLNRAGPVLCRKRVGDADAAVWILKGDAGQQEPGVERRRSRCAVVNQCRRNGVINSGAAADHRILADAIGESNARSEVGQRGFLTRAGRAPLVAAKD